MLKMKLPGIKKRGRSKKRAMGVVRENMVMIHFGNP